MLHAVGFGRDFVRRTCRRRRSLLIRGREERRGDGKGEEGNSPTKVKVSRISTDEHVMKRRCTHLRYFTANELRSLQTFIELSAVLEPGDDVGVLRWRIRAVHRDAVTPAHLRAHVARRHTLVCMRHATYTNTLALTHFPQPMLLIHKFFKPSVP